MRRGVLGRSSATSGLRLRRCLETPLPPSLSEFRQNSTERFLRSRPNWGILVGYGGEGFMDCAKVGKLILRLRKEKGLTQGRLADALGVSDKAVSKWERGLGCPDVTLLAGLSRTLEVDIERMLAGDLDPSERDGGNMMRLKFYVCPTCGRVMTATGEGELSCCGRKLPPLVPREADQEHRPQVEEMETEWYLTFRHGMTKDHHLSFAACATYDRVLLVKLYPEQDAALRLPRMNGGRLFFYCTRHRLMTVR